MARPRDLLPLSQIADETGISYATLRNYAVKHADEIPSEGSGRKTRYPRAAIKVFQRLRKESRPGRKPGGATIERASAPAAPPKRSRPVPGVERTDTGGIERELAAIRVHLGNIAESLGTLVSLERDAVTVSPVEAVSATPVPQPAPAVAAKESRVPPAARGLMEVQETGGQRRLHTMPKVRGQRGQRPE